MAKHEPTVEAALTDLQRLVRRPPSEDPSQAAISGEVLEDLQAERFVSVYLLSDERRALEAVRAALAADLRFEHLKAREIKDATWRFVCRAHREETDLVPGFVGDHGHEVMDLTCYLPVEFLTVGRERALFGVTFVPLAELEVPQFLFGKALGPEVTTALAIPCRGTNYERMKDRALGPARHALRLLRVTLREEQFMPDFQLRFRLGELYWFDNGLGGWVSRPDSESDLELDDQLCERLERQEIATLKVEPDTDVDRRVLRALRWFERAQLEVDPAVGLLFLFSALEAILGEKSGREKGSQLALRRAMLGLLTRGSFSHPSRAFLLYDKVRSHAIHGEDFPDLSRKEVDSFAWDVRRAINEFLAFARERGFTKRARVRNALDGDERRSSVVAGLLRDQPKLWGKYLDPPGEPDSAASADHSDHRAAGPSVAPVADA